MGWADFTSEQRSAYGKKIAANLKAKDPDFYKKIGAKGGKTKSPSKGFGSMDSKSHSAASRKGGKNSSGQFRKKLLTDANACTKLDI